MAAVAAAVPAIAAPPPDACPSVRETLKWTAEALLAVRDGKPSAGDAGYVADAAEYMLDRLEDSGWSATTLDAASRIFDLADAGRETGLDAAQAAELLSLADAISAEAATTCGADIVPVFARPGVGDTRACGQVGKALKAVARVLPTIAGKPGAPSPILIYHASKEVLAAKDQATASRWSAASLSALGGLAVEMKALNASHEGFGTEAVTSVISLAAPVVDEARTICGADAIPEISG